MAPTTAGAPSLSRSPLCRYSSEIRTGCANERPSGSLRGVPGNWYPYRDLNDLARFKSRRASFYKTSKCKAEVLETRRGEPRIVRCPQVRQCGLDARRPRQNPNAPPVVAPVSDVARHRNLIVVMLLRVGRSAEGDGV